MVRKTIDVARVAASFTGVLVVVSGCGGGGGSAAEPDVTTTMSTVVTTAQACATIKSQTLAIYGNGRRITHAKDWLPLHRELVVWEGQGGELATTVRPFEAVVEKRLETPDHDEYGLRTDASAADDAIVLALHELAPKCAAVGVSLKG